MGLREGRIAARCRVDRLGNPEGDVGPAVAEAIGFYGTGVIGARRRRSRPHPRLGFLPQQSTRDLHRLFAQKIREVVLRRSGEEIETEIEFVDAP